MVRKTFCLVAPLALGILAHTSEAAACGGCFVPPDENTQVTGHRMVMSVGMDQSSLYDQIQYSGSPESFAWVLPTKGQVEVGVSSDLVFNQLGFDSSVTVAPPVLNCPGYECGYADGGLGSVSSVATSAGSGGGGVDVIAQEVVGPYETVQLASSDPAALSKWLADHGYKLPKDIEPLVGSYVGEGFNFLAVKLVPGKDVQAMQPIRITTKGSSVALPLRMVAAGTGALTTISLYVLGEFRAETANFPGFAIDPAKVVWDYNQDRSNYTDLRSQGYAASKGFGWLTESAKPYSPSSFRFQIFNVIDFGGPGASGYGTDPSEAYEAATEDLGVLFHGMDENQVWLTRLRAELPREALGKDLVLQAAASQVEVPRFIQTTKYVGQQPACPPIPPGCEESGDSGGFPATSDLTAAGGGGCAMSGGGFSELAFGGALLALGAVVARRRKN